jgi:hypothetical protein
MSFGHASVPKTAPSEALQSAEAQARGLRTLLGERIMGVWQSVNGSYGDEFFEVADADLLAHFRDERTLAVAPLLDVASAGGNRRKTTHKFPRTNFIGFDIDDRFWIRYRLLLKELERRGFPPEATICSGGSDKHRGKVIVFFNRPYDARQVRNIGEAIRTAAQSDPTWGIENPSKKTEVFPLRGTGGLFRIGGRNLKPSRNATAVDPFFDCDGVPTTLAQVQPATRLRLPVEPVPISVAPVGAWVAQARKHGLCYRLPAPFEEISRKDRPLEVKGTDGLNKFVERLAFEAIRFHVRQGAGYARACEQFQSWLADVERASVHLDAASPTSGDKRPALSWHRRGVSAWAAACESDKRYDQKLEDFFAGLRGTHPVTLSSPKRAKPLDNVTPPLVGSDLSKLTDGERRVLMVLYNYPRVMGVTPDCFGISYRKSARLAGLSSPKLAHRATKRLVNRGLVVIHDRGTQGKRGLPTILGLVSESVASRRHGAVPVEESDRRVIAETEAARICAERAETAYNLRARRARIEQFRRAGVDTQNEAQREAPIVVESTNVVNFTKERASRRPRASIAPPENMVLSLAEAQRVPESNQTIAPVDTTPSGPPKTISVAEDDERLVREISLRGLSIGRDQRDALLSRLSPGIFTALHDEAAALVDSKLGFLRALPERFEAAVRSQIVDLLSRPARQTGASPP